MASSFEWLCRHCRFPDALPLFFEGLSPYLANVVPTFFAAFFDKLAAGFQRENDLKPTSKQAQ
jgi:hypothetical protein